MVQNNFLKKLEEPQVLERINQSILFNKIQRFVRSEAKSTVTRC
jgi:hypothetical protein